MAMIKSRLILIYLPCAFAIMIFGMGLLFHVLGYWVGGGEDTIGFIKDNFYTYLKMAVIGFVIGFFIFLFKIR